MGHGETNEQLGKGEGAAQKIDPPTNTIASGDESAMNVPGKQTSQSPLNAANFVEFTFFAARDLRGTFLLLPADDGPLES